MGMKGVFRKIRKFLKDEDYRFIILSKYGFLDHMDDLEYVKRLFRANLGQTLDLGNPRTFNEKLQWIKLYDRRPEYTVLVDKYLVKDYVASRIGRSFIIPTIGVWERAEDIDFDSLPLRFVLKCNHNSGTGMYICKDRNALTEKQKMEIRKGLSEGLKEDYYLKWREWPYKDVPRRIIAEQYIEDPVHGQLMDYKFFCFNGKVKCFKIDFDRFSRHGANYYDLDGNLLPFCERLCPADSQRALEMPENLKTMVEKAEILAAGCSFARVDFYEVEGQVFFGEFTLFPACGLGLFDPEEWDLVLGSWIDLPVEARP